MGVMDGLQGATDEQKRAALAAMAQAGQRGLAAYKAGIGNVDASQRTAMDRVAGRAGYLGADAQGELSSIAAQPGDAARVALQRAQAQFEGANAQRQAATGAYFDQVSAAVPLSKQYGDNQIGLARQKAEQEQAAFTRQNQMAEEEHRRRL